MYGAVLGDIIGSAWEFETGPGTEDFPLFSENSVFTDDTVMTTAVAEALMDTMGSTDETIRSACVHAMQRWGRRYPGAGYGRKFQKWIFSRQPRPYRSCGNGSAMRVSPAGWLAGTLEEAKHLARLTAEVTHNHEEGIRGAETIACAVFLARTGNSKERIRTYVTDTFRYDLSRTCAEIRLSARDDITCQRTVPESLAAFLEGDSLEDVIRAAVSLGGDTDTLGCIAGSVAEAFYGIPEELKLEVRNRLPGEMLQVLDRFDGKIRGQ